MTYKLLPNSLKCYIQTADLKLGSLFEPKEDSKSGIVIFVGSSLIILDSKDDNGVLLPLKMAERRSKHVLEDLVQGFDNVENPHNNTTTLTSISKNGVIVRHVISAEVYIMIFLPGE